MSLLRYKQKLLPYGSPMGGGDGGGGGGSQPTQTTSYNTNIPEYAKPYVTGMLEATQKQIYNDDRTSFRPYTPYSTDVNQYFAGFSPMQQQAQYEAANMQQPGQFALGSGLAGAGGIGSLGLAGQAAGLGGQYAQMAQDPRAMQGYMSPYMQNVVDYQKSQALRDYQIASPMRARQAVGAGAFGGSRQAIMEAEAQRSLGSQLQGITATGSQKAFEDAQRQQQFGAQLGLQGLQTGLQGLGQVGQMGATLGQLGSQQQAADIARQNQMSMMGKQQQDLEQQKINQAIQNYAIQQQYPMMQLGFMSNMLRGLPLQAQTTQLYQAQPSTTQQAVGLLGAGASLFGRREGGAIKEYREGGIASAYKYGGAISDPELEAMADRLSVAQLQERLRDPQLTPGERQIFSEALQEKKQEKDRMSGIALAGGPAFDSQGAVTAAGGGIIAFAGEDGSLVNEPDNRLTKEEFDALVSRGRMPTRGYAPAVQPTFSFPKSFSESIKTVSDVRNKDQVIADANKQNSKVQADPDLSKEDKAKIQRRTEEGIELVKKDPNIPAAPSKGTSAPAPTLASTTTAPKEKTLADYLTERKALGPKGQVGEEFEKYLTDRLGKQTERSAAEERERRAKFFLEMGGDPMGYLSGARKGAIGYITDTAASRKAQDAMEGEAQKARMELEKARRAEERGDVAGAQEARDKATDHDLKRQQIQASYATAGAATKFEKEAVERVMAENPGMKFADALQIVKGAGRSESNQIQQDRLLLEDIGRRLLMVKPGSPEYAELIRIRNEVYSRMNPGGGIGGGQGGVPQGVTVKKVG